MKFICPNELIKKEIENAFLFVSPKNTLNILSNVYLETHDDILIIKSTDGKSGFTSKINVQTIESGTTTVYCEKFAEVLRRLPDINLEFSEADRKLTIKPTDNTKIIKVNLKTLEADRYPELKKCDESLYFSLPLKDFIFMADKCVYAIAVDTSRKYLTGVYFEQKNEHEIASVATDGRKLAYVKKYFEQEIPKFKASILTDKFLKNLKSVSLENEPFSLAFEGENIFARSGEREFYSSVITEPYPNYERVIPKEYKYTCINKTEDFDQALSVIFSFTDQESKRVFMDMSEDNILINSENDDGDGNQIVKCKNNSNDMRISFNAQILAPTIKRIDSEFMRISYNSSSSAIGFYPDPEKDYFFILMPMQS